MDRDARPRRQRLLRGIGDAQESLRWYLELVFTVHGRLRPYKKWLEWELERHPLPSNNLQLARLERIARTADLAEQAASFRDAEPPRLEVERRGNLVLIGQRRQVDAAVARLP